VGEVSVISLGGNTYTLRGGQKHKLCADEKNMIKCNRNAVGQWEKFTMYDVGGGKFALRGGHGKKLCADEGNTIRCNRDAVGQWEKFTIFNV